jgi:hypothetical protein
MLKYNTMHVGYMTILWLLKHVQGAIMFQIGIAMCHWIQLIISTNYCY